jgi:hypothetical protein
LEEQEVARTKKWRGTGGVGKRNMVEADMLGLRLRTGLLKIVPKTRRADLISSSLSALTECGSWCVNILILL